MSLTLAGALQTAQDGAVHNPIIEITSHNPVASLPFDGYKISGLSSETKPRLIRLATGRLVYTYIYNNNPYMGYSDLERTQWYNGNALNTDANYNCTSIDCCEMPDGNIAIIVVLAHKTSNIQYVQGMIYTPTATLVNGRTTAFTWTTNKTDYGITLNYNAGTYRWILGARNSVPNPNQYYFRTGTSSNMTSWNTATTFTPSGLSNLYRYGNPYLFFPINDNPILMFDYVESYSSGGEALVNIYMMTSTDGGATWGTPTKITNFTTYGKIGYEPALSQNIENELLFTYREDTPTLYIGSNAAGWSQTDKNEGEAPAAGLAFDEATRKVYVITQGWGYVDHSVHGVTEVDLDTMTATDYWDYTSSPAFGPNLFNNDVGFTVNKRMTKVYNDKIVIYMGSFNFAIINVVANTIKYWSFKGYDDLTANVNHGGVIGNYHSLDGVQIDSTGRVWMMWTDMFAHLTIGFIHVDDAGPTYTFTVGILNENRYQSGQGWADGSDMRVFYEEGYVLTSSYSGITGASKAMALFTLSGNTINFVKRYDIANAVYNFPVTTEPLDYIIQGNIIYLIFAGVSGFGMLNMDDDFCTWVTPPQTVLSSYMNYEPSLNMFIFSGGSGLYTYALALDEWKYYNNTTINGITPNNSHWFTNALYDSETDAFIVGLGDSPGSGRNNYGGFVLIPREGKIQQIQYRIGTEAAGWTFGAVNKLIKDYSATHATTAYAGDGTSDFYGLWVDVQPNSGANSLTWDKSETLFDLTKYIVDNTDVKWRRNITGAPNQLDFKLAPGHLFDEWNAGTMLAKYTVKGRKLVLRAGERVSGTNYFVNQGTYYITKRSISYSRGEHPIISITATDKLDILLAKEIEATELKSNLVASLTFKEYAIAHGAVSELSEIDSTPFINDTSIPEVQFIDMTLYDILYTIAWRFGCMIRYDMNNKLDCVRLPNTTVNHTYSNQNAVFEFSPDDEYSDKTNRVIVTGIDPNQTQIVHAEEMVAQISGSVGWWGDPQTYTVWYSEDHEKRVSNPRLQVIYSAEAIAFKLAGGVQESITYEDPNQKYCKVKVDAPNLIPALAAAIGAYIAATNMSDIAPQQPAGALPTQPVGRKIEGIALFAALNILGSIASFQYEIWGQPIGQIQRTIQGEASDTANISYVGETFTKTIEGWYCPTTFDCTTVATRELTIVMMQRRRVTLEKTAHLQDEEGDTISIRHPISNTAMSVNIVELERIFRKGERGFFKDNIQGWVLV